MERHIIILAHNIRSVWNVGSLFRTADAFGIQKIYLTGYTGTPPSKEINKTALGAEQWIPWEKREEPFELIEQLKADGFSIVSLEKTTESIALQEYSIPQKIVLILGHEILGVSTQLQAVSDATVHIPMLGQKESLNVSVACGVALYGLRFL
jgi:23S rRNA (guanosine2251-2'-O)-methyltransferase